MCFCLFKVIKKKSHTCKGLLKKTKPIAEEKYIEEKTHGKVKVFVVVVDIGEQPSGTRKGENSYVKENRNGQRSKWKCFLQPASFLRGKIAYSLHKNPLQELL